MAKVRVYELAKELGVESKILLNHLKEQGEFVRSASSTIEPPVVRKVRESFPAQRSLPPGGTRRWQGQREEACRQEVGCQASTAAVVADPLAPVAPCGSRCSQRSRLRPRLQSSAPEAPAHPAAPPTPGPRSPSSSGLSRPLSPAPREAPAAREGVPDAASPGALAPERLDRATTRSHRARACLEVAARPASPMRPEKRPACCPAGQQPLRAKPRHAPPAGWPSGSRRCRWSPSRCSASEPGHDARSCSGRSPR